MAKKPKNETVDEDRRPDAVERMNKALEEALKTPPKPFTPKKQEKRGADGEPGN